MVLGITARLPTGVPGLDEVLGGGLPDSSINLVSGPPGVGKTVLAQQIVYTGASEERPAVYFTTVAEPYEKIITHVQPFHFYRREYPGKVVHYVDLGATMAGEGLEGVLRVIKTELTELFPRYVVIDSFRALSDFARSAREMTLFIYELAGTLSALKCVTLLLDESPAREIMAGSAAAVADGIVHLHSTLSGRSNRRWVSVLKMRGSDYLAGSHFIRIDAQGVKVYPRLGSTLPDVDYAVAGTFCPTGVSGLDEVLGGGLSRGSCTIVTGELGTGKTVFALHFIVTGALRGEPGVFVSLRESPAWLAATAGGFGWDMPALEEAGFLSVNHVPLLNVEVDRLGHELLEEIDRLGARRVAIDAITDLDTAAIPDDDYQGFLYALGQILQRKGVAAVFTAATSTADEAVVDPLPAGRLVDAMVRLDLKLLPNSVSREMRVLKVRGSSSGVGLLDMRIQPDLGMTVAPCNGSARGRAREWSRQAADRGERE